MISIGSVEEEGGEDDSEDEREGADTEDNIAH